jgi:hypothetical protein
MRIMLMGLIAVGLFGIISFFGTSIAKQQKGSDAKKESQIKRGEHLKTESFWLNN